MPVALFHEGQSAGRSYDSAESRRVRKGWIFLAIAVAAGLVLGIAPSPYVIEKPGPVIDTLGTAEHDGEQRPLIVIPDETTYPTDGSLNLLTVSVVGNRESRPNWFEVLSAWASPQKAVLPLDAIFPADVSTEDRDEANQVAMANSQQDAIAAALTELGYDFPRTLIVKSLPDGSPAEGLLLEGDEILAVNGETLADVQQLRSTIAENGVDSPASVTVKRGDQTLDVAVTPAKVGDATILGVNVASEYDLPIEVQIQLDNVGGPSAGMMFALGIIDKLTPGALTGGKDWAGTGTIDSAGNVGPIGGIRQKMFGAKDAGANWFLAPEANCAEVVGHVPDGLNVFAADTLEEALTAIETVTDGGDTTKLATCSLPASAQ